MKLTDRTVLAERLPAGKADIILFDDKLPGFGLRIRSGGKKTWIAQYRFGTAQRRLNIGSIDEVNAAKARQSAADIFAKVRLGQDPQAERRSEQQKAGDVFEELGQRYLKAAKARVREGSYREIERHIEKYWAPFNRRSIHAINRADIAKRIGEIGEASGIVTANRARATLAAVFTWAMRQGELEANPVTATNKAGEERPRDRVLPDSEIIEVWKACRDDDFGTIVRLLILTGQRGRRHGRQRNQGRKPALVPPPRSDKEQTASRRSVVGDRDGPAGRSPAAAETRSDFRGYREPAVFRMVPGQARARRAHQRSAEGSRDRLPARAVDPARPSQVDGDPSG